MVFNPLADFSVSERVALPFIHSLINVPISANEILGNLASAGIKIRRQSGLSLISSVWQQTYGAGTPRTIRNGEFQFPTTTPPKGRNYIKSVRNDLLPNPDRFGVAATRTKRQYTYTVRMDYRQPGVAGLQSQYVNVASDTLMTKNDVLAIVGDYEEGDPTAYPFEYTGMVVENVIRAAPSPVVL